MHVSPNKAVSYSLGLHFGIAVLLLLVRAGIPAEPPVITVDWVELTPSLGTDEVTSSPNQGAASKPIIKSVKPAAPAPTESGLAAAAESAPATGTYSAEVKARRMSAEEFYRASVRQTLEQRKVYPPLAQRLGQTGTVVLKFVLGKDGSLLASEIAEASPYPVLNEAAKNLLVSAKFGPMPAELEKPSWEFTIPVEYRLGQRLTKSL
jgi:protein TonB